MSNFPATLAAVAARGARCDHCGHWTFRPARPPQSGSRPADRPLCGNCGTLTFTPAVVRIPGRRS